MPFGVVVATPWWFAYLLSKSVALEKLTDLNLVIERSDVVLRVAAVEELEVAEGGKCVGVGFGSPL